MCMLNNKFSFWAIMEYFCLHTFHEENIVLSYYYITCMHTCGTYSNLAVSGSISKSSRTGDFGMLSRYLSEKQRVYDYEKISNTMCCNLLTTLGQIGKALYWYLTFPLNFVSERTRLKTFSLPLTLKLEACLSFNILIQKLIDLFIRRNSIFQVFVKHYIFNRTITYLRLHNTIVHSPHSIQGHFTIQVNGSC